MRFKGKLPIFNYRDTFSLDSTLSPIILAGLIRFKEVLQERHSQDKCIGVPHSVFDRLEILPETSGGYSEKQLDIALEEWFNMLDKMIVGFSEEPKLKDYGVEFEHNILDNSECDEERGWKRISIDCLTPDRLAEYRKDCQEHRQQALEGRKLFAEYFEDLWW